MDVLITRPLPGIAYELLDQQNISYQVFPQEDRMITKPELLSRCKSVKGIISLLTDRIDQEVIKAAPNLTVIANYAVGFDNIDIACATDHRIMVTNTPGVLTDATADLTIALILSLIRRITRADKFTREGRFQGWSPTLLVGGDLTGKNFGLIGTGRIGQAVAQRISGFNVNLIYNSPSGKPDFEEQYNAVFLDLPELLRQADIISIHVPLTDKTHHLLNKNNMKLLKPNCYIINTSRGPVIDEVELVKLLKQNRIAGAALDVFENEPKLTPGLADLENVILTPHIGSASEYTRNKMAEIAATNIIQALSGKIPDNLINREVLEK
ncbi:MAG: 2-hydroxyacid dehydrogenase [bacterium]